MPNTNNALDLLSSQSRIAVPFVKVTIGENTFGVFQKSKSKRYKDDQGTYHLESVQYPNYIDSLEVKKINGDVNLYTLRLIYAIRPVDDPNFIHKVLSSVADTRKIIFTYGDLSAPNFIAREEEAIITSCFEDLDMTSARITYTISAVSSAKLAKAGGVYTFTGGKIKPSDRIKQILFNKTYGLQDIFTGMRDKSKVLSGGLIASNDNVVEVSTKANISVLDYLIYLVSCMTPISVTNTKSSTYTITIVDDVTGEFAGTYFKVIQVSKIADADSTAYNINIGIPGNTVVTSFKINDNQTYSILYKHSKKITSNDYVNRINNNGELEAVYAPIISSDNPLFTTTAADASWWTSVTEFPVKGTITVKGLLRPAILMSHVRIKLYYYGKLYLTSGLYIITSQLDRIDGTGFTTTLGITRVGKDDTI